MAGIVSSNICVTYGLEMPNCRWKTSLNRAKVLWDFKFQTEKKLVVNKPDIAVAEKEQKNTAVTDVAFSGYSNTTKKEHEKIEKYQRVKE